MRVGVFFPSFPPEIGGGHVFEYEILLALAKLAHESRHHFTLFIKDRASLGGAIPLEASNLSVAFFNEVPPVPEPDFQARMQGRLKKVLGRVGLIEEEIIKVMGTEELFQMAVKEAKLDFFWNPSMYALSTDMPYIATVWDIQHRLQPWFPEVSSRDEWEQREEYFSKHLRKATFIITGNQAGRQELSFFYQIPEQRFRLLPLPAPEARSVSSQTVASTLAKYSLSPGYLFYPAQFWAHKNHVNLLFALQILRDKYGKKMELVLVGSDQGNIQYVREVAGQLGLMEQLHILGFVPRDDLMVLYKGALALTFVTFFGPDNLPPLEAFSLGCPVIASAVHGAEEQLGDSALLVDPTAAPQIAERIYHLSNDISLRERLIVSGYESAKKWTSSDFVRGVFNILDEFETIRRCWPPG
jgi:glycosyltransferase involved in cell wall biosynthesis